MNTPALALSERDRAAPAARFAIALIFFVNGFAFSSWVPHIPTVKDRLSLTSSQLGLALLGVAAGSLVSMPITGGLITRWGSRRVTLVSTLLFCLVVALPIRAPSLLHLVAALVALGATSGSMDVAMNAQGIVVERRLGRPIMSSLHALFSLGGLLGAGGTMVALSAGISPSTHMAMAATFSLLLACGAGSFLLPPSTDDTGTSHPFALPRGPLLVLGLLAFLVMMTEGAMADWSAVYLSHALAASSEMAGAGYAVFSLAMATGRFTGDRLVTRFGPVPLLRFGGALAACGLGVALVLHHPFAAVIGFGCVGLGVSNIVPILFSTAGRMPGTLPGAAIAAVSTTGYGGFLAGPPLVGFIADRTGLPLALGLLVVFMAIIAVNAAWVRPKAAA